MVEQNEVDPTADSIYAPKNIDTMTGVVMPGNYSPHQEYELEDAEDTPVTRRHLEEVIQKYDCIVSKHTNDINTSPLLKMEIETEGPPVAS